MNKKDIKTASKNVASKLLVQRGRLRSFLFHRGGKKVVNVAVDHLLGITEEVLRANNIICDESDLNGPVAHGVATASRELLQQNQLKPSWQVRREGLVSPEPITLTSYWKPIVSRRDNLVLPSAYKLAMQHESNVALRYNRDMTTAVQGWQKKFGPEDKPVLSVRDLEAIAFVGFDPHWQQMSIACRVARRYQSTQGAGGYQNGKGVRACIEFAEGRKVTKKQLQQFLSEIKEAVGYTKAHSKYLGENTLANRIRFLNKYGDVNLLRSCLELIYMKETKKSTMIMWQDVHTSLVCHIHALTRDKKLASIVNINDPRWYNRHDYFYNIVATGNSDSAAFFRALNPALYGLFIKASFTPFGHGSGATSAMHSALDTDDKHWNAEAPDLMEASMSLAEFVAAVTTGKKAFTIPNNYKLALRSAWPGWAKKKVITEDQYKTVIVTIFKDLKGGFNVGFKRLTRYNSHAIAVKETCALLGREMPTCTNRFDFKLVQARWKRDPNRAITITNRTDLSGPVPVPLEVTFDRRVPTTGSEFAVSIPQWADGEMSCGITCEFEEVGKDLITIHDAFGKRLEDSDFFTEVSSRQFLKTHETPYLNELGFDVPKKLPALPDNFRLTRA
tara:strand:+ start:305 stop:2155 length:1851 start_codon:yes stop_codon:yes gene_type:complete